MKIRELCRNICPSWPKFVVFTRTSPNFAEICYILLFFERAWGGPGAGSWGPTRPQADFLRRLTPQRRF